MKQREPGQIEMAEAAEAAQLRSIYDPPEDDEDDLWFLPDPEVELPDAPFKPIAASDWAQAEGAAAGALADAAFALGQLDRFVAEMGQGAITRLALREAEALMWVAGTPLTAEDLARDQLQARVSTDRYALQSARWAMRRLTGQGELADLRAFLGLHMAELNDELELSQDMPLRLTGQHFDDAADAFLTRLDGLRSLHALTIGAAVQQAWGEAELSAPDTKIEALVWAARAMAEGCEALPFVPLGHGMRRFYGAGPDKLGGFYAALYDSVVTAKAELARVHLWQEDALRKTAQIKGSTPELVIAALIAQPMATTEMVEQAAGVSRDTAERVLARLQVMGVVREITGARRFRIWAAQL